MIGVITFSLFASRLTRGARIETRPTGPSLGTPEDRASREARGLKLGVNHVGGLARASRLTRGARIETIDWLV